jgi:hypothetical protein
MEDGKGKRRNRSRCPRVDLPSFHPAGEELLKLGTASDTKR